MIPAHDQRHVVGEIEMLRGTDTPENIARRVGFPNKANLSRQLNRWGRQDLAVLFERKLVSTSGGSGEESHI